MHFAFHIGAHKTATTSFQHSLRATSRSLRAAGVSVVGKRSKRYGRERYYSSIAPLLKRSYEPDEIKQLGKAAADALKEVCAEDKTHSVFLSDEAILGDMPGQMIGFYPQSHEILEEILNNLKPTSISISLVTRKQDSFIWSCYKQMYQLGRPLLLEEYLDRAKPQDANWHNFSTRLYNVVGNALSVTPYENIKNVGGTLFFQEILNRSLPHLDTLPTLSSVGSSNISLDLKTMLNAMAMRAEGINTKEIQMSVLNSRGNDKSRMPNILSNTIMTLHNESNMKLFEQFIPQHLPYKMGYTTNNHCS
ncbi:hypothetical protein ACMG4P_25945 [Pseudovibrio denitrificans]|uniref:hypothetical protein n=1 Tax=Pseudovibrio denitrificans TaxID=258256 RepID=UPI0039BFC3D2